MESVGCRAKAQGAMILGFTMDDCSPGVYLTWFASMCIRSMKDYAKYSSTNLCDEVQGECVLTNREYQTHCDVEIVEN